MFVGSINSKIRNLIFTEKKIFQGQKVCVGCSGNFTVEQILQGLDCEIWSNDVALYSSLIGNYLSGKSMRAEIKDPAYSWLTPYMEEGVAETVVFILGGTRKRIKKETAKLLRKAIKENMDSGLDLDESLKKIIQ